MVETSFNLFDAIVLGTVFLSTLLSFFRGFVRELLSLGSWIGAMAITVLYTPDLADAIRDDVDKGQAAAMLVASLTLFFGAKIIFSIMNMLLMKMLKPGKEVGVLDNVLGLVFGFTRAALLLSLGYYVYSFVASEDNQPGWIAHSYTKPYVAQGAQMLEPLLDGFVQKVAPMAEERAEQIQPGSFDALKSIDEIDPEDMERLKQVDSDDLQRLMEQLQQQQESDKPASGVRRP